MQIRQAILMAADFIEAHPAQHLFARGSVPSNLDDKGCPLAWAGYFFGDKSGSVAGVPTTYRTGRLWWRKDAQNISAAMGLLHLQMFFDRMYQCCLDTGTEYRYIWHSDAGAAARSLRKYADKYHPAAKTPDWEALSKPDERTFATTVGEKS